MWRVAGGSGRKSSGAESWVTADILARRGAYGQTGYSGSIIVVPRALVGIKNEGFTDYADYADDAVPNRNAVLNDPEMNS